MDRANEQLSFRPGRSTVIPPAVQQELQAFIDGGARRLSEEGATPERIAGAETNLDRFVSALIQQASRGSLSAIDKGTIAAVRRELCPFYPFC